LAAGCREPIGSDSGGSADIAGDVRAERLVVASVRRGEPPEVGVERFAQSGDDHDRQLL
jgi:hypothetical protein